MATAHESTKQESTKLETFPLLDGTHKIVRGYQVRYAEERHEMEVLFGDDVASVAVPRTCDWDEDVFRDLVEFIPNTFRMGMVRSHMCGMDGDCDVEGCAWDSGDDADVYRLALFVDPAKKHARSFSTHSTYDWKTLRGMILDELRDATNFVRIMLKHNVYIDLPNMENLQGLFETNTGFSPHIYESARFLSNFREIPLEWETRLDMTIDLFKVAADWVEDVLKQWKGDAGPCPKHPLLRALSNLFWGFDHIVFNDAAEEDYEKLLVGIATHLRIVLGPEHVVDMLDSIEDSDGGSGDEGDGSEETAEEQEDPSDGASPKKRARTEF